MIDYLESLYKKYNSRAYLHSDPLEFVYQFDSNKDREIAGFLSATYAVGRVDQIRLFLSRLFERLTEPVTQLININESQIQKLAKGLYYRFYKEEHIAAMLQGISGVLKKYGSLEECFSPLSQGSYRDKALFLSSEIRKFGGNPGSAVPVPKSKAALKRIMLFLRWMIRHDDVDPGCWSGDPGRLCYPVDTHILRIAGDLGMRVAKGSWKDVETITSFFKSINPDDPVKYDFALTREPILSNLTSGG